MTDVENGKISPINSSHVYLDIIKKESYKTLSLMDREVLSPTLGCMDRTYWAWKFTDFPGARFQEGLCILSFLYSTNFEGNNYYHNPKLLQWISTGFEFWMDIQDPSGYLNEAYPFERSLAATAFTSFYLSEAWNFLDGELKDNVGDRFKHALELAGDWLIKNDETHGFLSNHLAAAAAALYHCYIITGNDRFEKRSKYFIQRILDHQSAEGWYDEYGGPDPGYQTHGSFYLARYLEISEDPHVKESLDRSLSFLAHFIHPDGSLGGEYASRNTQTYYPAAFEMMSGDNGSAHWIASKLLSSVQDLSAAGLGSVDAYNYFPLLNNYVFAYLSTLKKVYRSSLPVEPQQNKKILNFPEAGLLKVRTKRYDLFVGISKGGVLKGFDRKTNRLILNDCGYIGKLKDGTQISSQWCDNNRKLEVTPNEILVEGVFYKINRTVFKSISFLVFRAFNLTFGRVPGISSWLKSKLVNTLIYKKHDLKIKFVRKIKLFNDKITVQDHIQGDDVKNIENIRWADVFTTIHMGSSRYFLPNELEQFNFTEKMEPELNLDQISQGLNIERTITLNDRES